MVRLRTFTTRINQMLVNIPYIEYLGMYVCFHHCMCIYWFIYIYIQIFNWGISVCLWMFFGWTILVFPCPFLHKEKNESHNHKRCRQWIMVNEVTLSLACLSQTSCFALKIIIALFHPPQTKLRHGTRLTDLNNLTPSVRALPSGCSWRAPGRQRPPHFKFM